MKNRIKYLALFTIMFIFSACSGLFEFKPYFTTFVYDHRIYGIIENGKENYNKSRRVEFKIKTTAEAHINDILKAGGFDEAN